jgi:hypothetical protein
VIIAEIGGFVWTFVVFLSATQSPVLAFFVFCFLLRWHPRFTGIRVDVSVY